MSLNVTWTKLFVYSGAMLAAAYAVSAYVTGAAESRLAAWSSRLDRAAAQQQALGNGLAALRQAIEADRARADATADGRAQAVSERLAAAEGRLTDRLKALEAVLAALRPAAAPPSASEAPPQTAPAVDTAQP